MTQSQLESLLILSYPSPALFTMRGIMDLTKLSDSTIHKHMCSLIKQKKIEFQGTRKVYSNRQAIKHYSLTSLIGTSVTKEFETPNKDFGNPYGILAQTVILNLGRKGKRK